MQKEDFEELIDHINILKKSNAITKQNQSRIETKIDRIIDFLRDRKNREREKGY